VPQVALPVGGLLIKKASKVDTRVSARHKANRPTSATKQAAAGHAHVSEPSVEDIIVDPSRASATAILGLQRFSGNQSVTRLIRRLAQTDGSSIIQRDPDDPANDQQLLAALLKVLRDRVTEQVKAGTRASIQQHTAAFNNLDAALKPVVQALLTTRATDCLNNARAQCQQSAQSARTELKATQHGLLESDVDPVGEITDGTASYLFDNFLYNQPVCAGLPQALNVFDQLVVSTITKAAGVTVVMTNNLQDVQTERNRVQQQVLQAFPQHQQDATTLGLTALTGDLTNRHAAAQLAYTNSDPVTVTTAAKNVCQANFDSPTLVTLVVAPYTQAKNACDSARMAYLKSARRVSQANVQAITPALTGQNKNNLNTMLGIYGLPFFDALIVLDSAVQKQCLSWCADFHIRQALQVRIPPPASAATLSVTLSDMGETQSGTAIFTVMQQANQVFIDVPQHVTVVAWQKIGTIRFPAAFSTGNYETDMACMKHQKQETVGTGTPSKVKLERYFVELQTACGLAQQQWVGAGRPPTGQYTGIGLAVGTWNIHVKNSGGSAEVFHIDSGYQNSPWRTQPNT
jgi:hypothetical protein